MEAYRHDAHTICWKLLSNRAVHVVTALGVLCCFSLFVCLTLLASFFLPSHLSFKNMYIYIYIYIYVLMRDEKEGGKGQAKSNKQQGKPT